MPRKVRVATGSRLHFGLFALGHLSQRQYGGVGAMIERPGLELEVVPRGTTSTANELASMAERANTFAQKWCAFHRLSWDEMNAEVRVLRTPPDHVGLGVGTQLGLAVAAGLGEWVGMPAQTALELALSVGRATRSAVGSYGFVLGGLVMEQGRSAEEAMSPLDCRIDMPKDWCFLLMRPAEGRGISGAAETSAMQELPAVPPEVTQALVEEAANRMIPAAATADFPAFAESLYRYGHMAGNCFAAKQGGPYNGPVVTALVETIRRLGGAGVGQSSWGPTTFTICEDLAMAERLRRDVLQNFAGTELIGEISPVCNHGAVVERME